MKFSSLGMSLLVLGLCLPLAAQRGPRGGSGTEAAGRQSLSQMDTNGDGKISREEWKGAAAAFDRLDSNHDGYITTDEFGQGRGGRGVDQRRASLQEMDADKDGKISRAEWKGPAAMFDQIDADKDGFITPEELRQSRPAPGGQRGGLDFSRMDANGDGKVSRDEWKGSAEMFDRLDADHDGVLTQDEMRTARR